MSRYAKEAKVMYEQERNKRRENELQMEVMRVRALRLQQHTMVR